MSKLNIAWNDIIAGAYKWRIWYMLGSGDIRSRYARTRLGQFWISLSLAVSAVILGLVWSILWKADVSEFLPFVVTSITLWGFLSTCLTDATDAFISNKHFILGHKIDISVIIYALVTRNFLFLLHNMVIIFIVFLIFQVEVSWKIFLFIPALCIVLPLVYFGSFFIAIVCLRFTDVKHVVSSGIQLLFYITPVIWNPKFLSEAYRDYLYLNPFYWIISILRYPLLGADFNLAPWLLSLGALCLAALIVPIFVAKYIRSIAFWV